MIHTDVDPTNTVTATRRLLGCGVLLGPLFATTVAVQALARDGYDLGLHPISMLRLGAAGWVQIANFVVAGLLAIAFGVGIRRALHTGRAGTWGPRLVVAFGVGLVIGGVFVTDPWLGFPVGVPAPSEPTWHAVVHDVAPGLALDAMIVAMLVFARRFAGLRERAWQAGSIATAVAIVVLTAVPTLDGISVRLAVAMALVLAWTTALALHLRTSAR